MCEQCSGSGFRNFGAPVLGVCGYSGSGKTTLLEAAIPHLLSRGLSVAVVKHDSHGFTVDQSGKDSDRFFRAGATVALRGPVEQFLRRGACTGLSLEATLADLGRDHDLVLVEGHKDTKLPKLWLSNKGSSLPPEEFGDVLDVLCWDSDRLHSFLAFIESWLPQAWNSRPVFGGVLIGANSSRMGRPKQLLKFGRRTLAEIAATAMAEALSRRCSEGLVNETLSSRFAILGVGPVAPSLQLATRLSDPPGLRGAVAGLLAAHRWNPRVAWIVSACDHPWLSEADVQLLLDQRKPGCWAAIPAQSDGHAYPTFGLFEPQSLEVLERALLTGNPQEEGISKLVRHPHTVILRNVSRGLFNANTLEDSASTLKAVVDEEEPFLERSVRE